MIMLLLIWFCASIVVCLALLAAAARPLPLMAEPMAAAREPAPMPEPVLALQRVEAAPIRSWSDVPSPPLHAATAHSQPLPAMDLPLSLPSIPGRPPVEQELSCPVSVL